jgi:hypothetical protein
MVAAHVLDERDVAGQIHPYVQLYAGRASALFAVLAGVSLALMSGGRTPRADGRTVGGLVVRALLIAALGLALGELETGIAVILTYYGVLFLLGLPFLWLRAEQLFVLAAAWAVLSPVASQLIRPELPERQYDSPTFGQLLDEPWHLLSELVLTGYYPALTWLAYLLLGLAIGRSDLRSRTVQGSLLVFGAAVAVLSSVVSWMLTGTAGVQAGLLPDAGMFADVNTAYDLLDALAGGLYGTTPTGGSWAWLLVSAPHSGTPFDLLTTGGSAAFVIGLCLLLVTGLPHGLTRVVQVVFGAGAMTLTLYSLHVVMRTDAVPPPEVASSFPQHLVVLGGIGAIFAAAQWPGPLERAVKWAQSLVAKPS